MKTKHLPGALMFCLFLIATYSLEAYACGNTEPEPMQEITYKAC